ncbi:MAG: GTPase Era [Eubacteriales bacterium]|jgi:GTP-binding protein Era
METKSLFIMISGRPNVGKSTLLNTLVGQKVAIVSRKPQTTRNRITGIVTDNENQFVFVDTPGLHKPKNLLGEYMMKAVGVTAEDADLVLFVVDASVPLNNAEKAALESYSKSGLRRILIINKVDITNKSEILKYIADISSTYDFDSVIPISALTGDGIDIVWKELKKYLVPSPHFFPSDSYTDQAERQIAAEIIREKALRLTDDEIPHGIAVSIEEFTEKKEVIVIRAEMYVEKHAHKRIIIGKDGAMLKKIGTYAREDMEKIFSSRIYLDIWVKVRENWRDQPAYLSTLGYSDK